MDSERVFVGECSDDPPKVSDMIDTQLPQLQGVITTTTSQQENVILSAAVDTNHHNRQHSVADPRAVEQHVVYGAAPDNVLQDDGVHQHNKQGKEQHHRDGGVQRRRKRKLSLTNPAPATDEPPGEEHYHNRTTNGGTAAASPHTANYSAIPIVENTNTIAPSTVASSNSTTITCNRGSTQQNKITSPSSAGPQQPSSSRKHKTTRGNTTAANSTRNSTTPTTAASAVVGGSSRQSATTIASAAATAAPVSPRFQKQHRNRQKEQHANPHEQHTIIIHQEPHTHFSPKGNNQASTPTLNANHHMTSVPMADRASDSNMRRQESVDNYRLVRPRKLSTSAVSIAASTLLDPGGPDGTVVQVSPTCLLTQGGNEGYQERPSTSPFRVQRQSRRGVSPSPSERLTPLSLAAHQDAQHQDISQVLISAATAAVAAAGGSPDNMTTTISTATPYNTANNS
eukprot:Lankesteria_metandrocarpae@DN8125_c0_g1_i1.p1